MIVCLDRNLENNLAKKKPGHCLSCKMFLWILMLTKWKLDFEMCGPVCGSLCCLLMYFPHFENLKINTELRESGLESDKSYIHNTWFSFLETDKAQHKWQHTPGWVAVTKPARRYLADTVAICVAQPQNYTNLKLRFRVHLSKWI